VLYLKTDIYFVKQLAYFFLKDEVFETKVVDRINQYTHFVLSNFFSKIVPFMT